MRPRISRLLRRSYTGRHYTTDARSPNYHPKVYAIPFALPADMVASPVDRGLRIFTRDRSMFVPVWVARLLGIDPFRLLKFDAVYVPTWSVDAEVLFRCTTKEGKTKESTYHIVGAQMSGHGHPELAKLCLNVPWDADNPPRPFSASLLKTQPYPVSDSKFRDIQFDGNAITLPYSVSPLSLPAIIRSIELENATLNDSTSFLPGSVRFDMIAATPILFPIYLAEYSYTVNGEETRYTAVVPAHDSSFMTFMKRYFLKDYRGKLDDRVQPFFFSTPTTPRRWVRNSSICRKAGCVVNQPDPDPPSHAVVAESDNPPSPVIPYTGNDLPLAQAVTDFAATWAENGEWGSMPGVANWDDARIVPWNADAQGLRDEYLFAGAEWGRLWVAATAKAEESKTVKTGRPQQGSAKASDEPKSSAEKEAEALVAQMQRLQDARASIRQKLGLTGEEPPQAPAAKKK